MRFAYSTHGSNNESQEFLSKTGAAALGATIKRNDWAQQPEPPLEQLLPATDADYQRSKSYIEEVPISDYHWASERAVEAFKDLKFGLRIDWGIYSLFGRPGSPKAFASPRFSLTNIFMRFMETESPRVIPRRSWQQKVKI